MNKKCLGCGKLLQSKETGKPGYVLESKLLDSLYCQRCFRLKHYHEMKFEHLSLSNQDLIEKINSYHRCIYYFVDLFHLNQESISYFKKMKGEKVLVLSKIDYVPFSISLEKFLYLIKNTYNIEDRIITLSKKEKELIAHLKNMIWDKKVVFAGMTNAGKSTCLSVLSQTYFELECPVLISEMPNTTQDFLEWNFTHANIIDAPGFNYEGQEAFSKEFTEKVSMNQYVKPLTFPIKKEEGILLEDSCYFQQSLEINSVTFWGSREIFVKKAYQKPSWVTELKEIKIPSESDLVLPGIGFFYFKKATEIQIFTTFNYEIRPSFLGGIHDSN